MKLAAPIDRKHQFYFATLYILVRKHCKEPYAYVTVWQSGAFSTPEAAIPGSRSFPYTG